MAELMPATVGGFPLENVNPKEKEKKPWLIQYCRAALGTYNGLNDRALGYRSRDRYEKAKAYAQARQPMQQYKDILTPQVDSDENGMNQLVVSDRIVPVLPKPRRIAISLIGKANDSYDVTINPIDPMAASELQDEAYDLKAKALLRNSFKAAGIPQMANAPAVARQPQEPDDLDGVEVAVLGLRHKAAMKSELVVKEVLNGNMYADLRAQVAEDLFDYGAAVLKDDTSGCMITVRKVDLRGFVCSTCIKPDFSDIRYAGELREIPVSEVVANSDGQVKAAELELIYKLSNNGSQPVFIGETSSWTSCERLGKVLVLDLEILTTDLDYREERTNKYGNPVFGKAKFGATSTDKRKVSVKKCQNIYRVKWVVGTDICYDLGLKSDAKYDPKNEARAKLSYHIVAGDVHDMIAYSRTESLMSFADAIQMRRMKLEHRFNTARPNGYSIDLSKMDEIAIGAGGKTMTHKDIIALLITHGILFYRSDSVIGDDKNQRPPIGDLVADLSDVEEYWNDIQRNLEMMNQTLGLNEVTDASAPEPKRLKNATDAAITGTNNALSDLFAADRRLMISLAEGVLVRAQELFRANKGEAFISALGAATVNFMKSAPNIDRYRFGVTIEDRPTPEQMANFEAELAQAVQSGQLGIDDVAMIRGMQNLKQREQYLVYKVRKNKEEAQAMELQKTQALGQTQIQSAQATSEFKQKELEIEYDLKSKLSLQEHTQRMEEGKQNILGNLEEERISGTGRVDAAYVQAKGRDASNIRDNQTALIKENKGGQAERINIPADLKTAIDPLTSQENPILPGIDDLQRQHFSFLKAPNPTQQAMPADEPEAPQEHENETPADENAEAPAQDQAVTGQPDKASVMDMLSGG